MNSDHHSDDDITLHSKFLNKNSDGCLPRFIETDDSFGHINQLENFMSDENFAEQ